MRVARLAPLPVLLLVPALAHAATTHEVGASGAGGSSMYSEPTVTVAAGDTVHWQSTGPGLHNVHFDGEAAGLTAPKVAGDLGARTFTQSGTVTYFCDVHVDVGMRGTIVVTGAGGPSPTATASPTASPTPTATPPPGTGPTGPAAPAVGRPAVARRVKGGRVRGTVKVTPAGTAYKLTVRALGHRVGRADRTATGKAQPFAVRLAKDARRRLARKGALRATVIVAAGDARASRSVRLRSSG
jgi:plastocyanin